MNPFAKRVLAVLLFLALSAASAMQVRHLVKVARAKRLITEAAAFLERKDFAQATRCLQAALQANPASVTATALTAELLESMGSSAAIGWRIRASQLQPANITNRLNWAESAVRLRDLKSAEDALSGVDENSKATARYHKIAGALAWGQGKVTEAEQHYQQARALEPDNPSNLLNLGTIGLVSTNEELAAGARVALQRIASTNGPCMLDAQRRLAQDAAKHGDLPQAVSYTRSAATNDAATFADKIDYLNLLFKTRDSGAARWLAVLKQEAAGSPGQAFTLGRWMLSAEGPTNTMAWLTSLPLAIRTNQPVPLVLTDSQIALKDWPGLLSSVEKQEWGEAENLRLAIESLARRSLGNEDAAQELWKRARRQSARQLDRLYRLVRVTSAWGWKMERRDLLTEIVAEFPQEKWAVDSLISQLCDDGQTEELERLFSKLSAADPQNAGLKTSLARVCLLRNDQLENAHRLAREAYDKKP